VNTATHRFESNAKANFIMAPESGAAARGGLQGRLAMNPFQNNLIESAQLPLDSGIPKMNAKKINIDI